MILKLQILLISVSLLFCILIFDMLRKKMIQLKYSLLWIITSFFLLLISIFPMIIEKSHPSSA